MKQISKLSPLPLIAAIAVTATACSGSSSSAPTDFGIEQQSGSSNINGVEPSDDGTIVEPTVEDSPAQFLAVGSREPIIYPRASIDEVEPATTNLLNSIDSLLVPVIGQMSDVFNLIDSGQASSDVLTTLEFDQKFYSELIQCSPAFDTNMRLSKFDCLTGSVFFPLRHPDFPGVYMSLDSYDRTKGAFGTYGLRLSQAGARFGDDSSLINTLFRFDSFDEFPMDTFPETRGHYVVTERHLLPSTDRFVFFYDPFIMEEPNINATVGVLRFSDEIVNKLIIGID